MGRSNSFSAEEETEKEKEQEKGKEKERKSKEKKEAWVKRCKEDIKMLYRMLEVSPTKKCCVSFGSVCRTVT